MNFKCVVLIGLFLIGGAFSESSAQNATAVSPLRFGNIYPGIPKKITKSDAGGAAEFHISGVAGDEVSIDFTLPTYMNSGPYHMQLVFGETDCAMDTLDPWHPVTYRLGSGGITIWLGGMVVPSLAQRQGDYSATIVLTVIPTGN
jgi:hypothetical protein